MVKRIAGFSIFFIVFLAVYGGMNYYVYLNVVRGFQISGGGLLLLKFFFVFLASAYPISQFLKRKRPVPVLYHLGALWMGVMSISISVFLVKDILSWVLPQNIKGEQFSMALIFILTSYALAKALKGPGIKTVKIQHKKLDESLNIVHLSDLHLNTMTSPKWLARVIHEVNNLEADIVVITGDMVDDSFTNVEAFAPVMGKLKAKHGVYAITGNHEYYMGIEHFHKFCSMADITMADNKFISITDNINLLGLDDKIAKAEGGIAEKTQELLSTSNADSYNILLVHQPVGFQKTAKLGIDLQLSGHTHRGQFFPFNLLVPLFYRYSYGLHAIGKSHIYTSSGTGTWGPPMRLCSSSEIVKILVN